VIDSARLLEDPPGEAALAWLRRAGFGEPERAARELRAIVADPRAATALRGRVAPLVEKLALLPDAEGALVRLERFVRAGGAAVLSVLGRSDASASDALLWALGGSPFLAEQVIRHPEWAEWLVRPGVLARPRRAGQVAADARHDTQGRAREAGRDALRRARRREVLQVAVRDLLRLSPVAETLQALSAVADGLVAVAFEMALAELSESRPPEAGSGSTDGLVVLGLGKLGGGELNFSSDVDLVYVHRGGRGPGGPQDGSAHELARQLTAVLGETTHEGHVYRVDLRLRPEGRAGALVHSLDAAEEYYGGRAATWERLALLKARRVAGDAAVGRQFSQKVAPFVWRKPFGAEEVRQVLRLKQEGDRRLAARGLLGRHVKLGRGGIREIELVVQVLQVRQGGALRAARCRGTLFALDALRSARALAAPEHDTLVRAYLFLRDVENKLQMAHDTQTHVLPDDEEAFGLLAGRLGYGRSRIGRAGAAARLRHDLTEQTSAVRHLYEELLGRLVRSGSAP
jgi:glutamate-ammonia-ligase adenylyltransferase